MALYQTQPDRNLRAKALAKEYGTGGHSHDYLDGSRGFVNHDGRGMEFDHYPEHKKFTLSWTQVEKYIDLMIQSDRYLTDKEKEHYTPPVSAEPDATLTHAKNLIREFCQEEYDSEPDFSDLSKIGVAYTNATDEDIPIQVNVDLVGYRVERYLGEVLIDERQYESLEELTETELEALDFSELVSVTRRANAYKILEDTLNLRDSRVYDTIEEDGKEKRVLNQNETTLAQQKQQAIKDAFAGWVWKDPQRRTLLVKKYNELFNSTRPREYDGSHIHFVGMNPEISLREHQRNAIAHVLYGHNTLLAHEVGAGKTFEMAAAAMESKRLGLCQKSLFVVPNHLTEQWASEFLHLYPNAKLLVTSRKDFEPGNRKTFCSRIATGDYDAIIIGHSQFEKIPLSAERQERLIQEQMDEIEEAIEEAKEQAGEHFTVKQLEKLRKTLKQKLEKLQAAERKDDVVTFEQLGVDRLFVDESQAFKNRAKRCA